MPSKVNIVHLRTNVATLNGGGGGGGGEGECRHSVLGVKFRTVSVLSAPAFLTRIGV